MPGMKRGRERETKSHPGHASQIIRVTIVMPEKNERIVQINFCLRNSLCPSHEKIKTKQKKKQMNNNNNGINQHKSYVKYI